MRILSDNLHAIQEPGPKRKNACLSNNCKVCIMMLLATLTASKKNKINETHNKVRIIFCSVSWKCYWKSNDNGCWVIFTLSHFGYSMFTLVHVVPKLQFVLRLCSQGTGLLCAHKGSSQIFPFLPLMQPTKKNVYIICNLS